ncbi:hypothetical protein HNY73_017471 [Argiope bruennichi]|uniref:Uncharacterized protein n=1 Tax=Argiope bruennichi TaxID=94029 RepID=A0A8T0E9S4_ARGBR|nr:hypothetical protein HNY73_017471 [Argiope bruennichi]
MRVRAVVTIGVAVWWISWWLVWVMRVCELRWISGWRWCGLCVCVSCGGFRDGGGKQWSTPVRRGTAFLLDKSMMAAAWMDTKFFPGFVRSNIGIKRLDNMAYIHAILFDKGTASTTSGAAFCSSHVPIYPSYALCEEVPLSNVEDDEKSQRHNADTF